LDKIIVTQTPYVISLKKVRFFSCCVSMRFRNLRMDVWCLSVCVNMSCPFVGTCLPLNVKIIGIKRFVKNIDDSVHYDCIRADLAPKGTLEKGTRLCNMYRNEMEMRL
jgi:hypothetical protein